MYDVSFDRPSFLYLLAGLLGLGLMSIITVRVRRGRLRTFGRPETVLGLSTLQPKQRRYSRLLIFAALACLMGAVAGPRWGNGENEGVIVGRDLVLIMDLSRSMTAKDIADHDKPARWQAATHGAMQLVDTIERRGGHRLAVVAFSAKAHVICPLTSDYDHVRARLVEFSPSAPPPETRPEPDEPFGTGTAIGAAIHTAIAAHDTRFRGYQDILLFSDGHGPDVERESEQGVKEAAERQIPVHVVGIGDPKRSADITIGDGDDANPVGTTLQEDILKEIARRTDGKYNAAQHQLPELRSWFTQAIENRPSRELSDDALPQPRNRAPWFLGIGLCLLLLAWVREP